MTHKPAERAIVAAHQKLSASLPFADTADMEDAARGFLAALSPAAVHAPDGRLVWDNDKYSFIGGEAPVTVNPSLWRQAFSK
jgi:alkyl sulfatase BDS1-like metallo-beta-lactamase superfamily hydrolase